MPERSKSQISLPMVDPKMLQSAVVLCEATIQIVTQGEESGFADLTQEQLEVEAKHIAALPDEEREAIVLQMLEAFIPALAEAQKVSGHLLWLARNLENTKNQLDAMSQSGVDNLRRHVDRSSRAN